MTEQVKKKTDCHFKELVEKSQRTANSKGFKVDWDTAPTYLMLIVTELSEAMEQWRDNHKEGFREEIADAFIRLFHLVGDLGLKEEMVERILDKLKYNETRPYRHGRARL
jgi:NTP pyrophosphatase (non-canonical NTP hydrolase)